MATPRGSVGKGSAANRQGVKNARRARRRRRKKPWMAKYPFHKEGPGGTEYLYPAGNRGRPVRYTDKPAIR